MSQLLTIDVAELILESHKDLTKIVLNLQLQQDSYSFRSPFHDIKFEINQISPEDIIYILVSSENEEIGQSQISLDPLLSSTQLERTITLTRSESSADKRQKSWYQKKINAGKIKLVLNLMEKSENFADVADIIDFEGVKEAYQLVVSIVKNFWDFEARDDLSIDGLAVVMFDNDKYQRNFDNDDVDHLRIVLRGLSEKVQLISVLQTKLAAAEYNSSRYLNLCEDLQEKIKQIQASFEYSNQVEKNKFLELQSENKQIKDENARLRQRILEQDSLILQSNSRIQHLTSEKALDASLVSIKSHYESTISSLRSTIHTLESSRDCLKLTLEGYQLELSDISSNFNSKLSSLSSELTSLSSKNLSLSQTIQSQSTSLSSQSSEIIALNSVLSSYKSQVQCISSLEAELSTLKAKVSSLSDQLQDSQIEYSKAICNFNSLKSQMAEEKEELWEHARDLQQENMKLQSIVNQNTSELCKAAAENEELMAKLIKLEENLVVQEDIFSLKEELENVKDIESHLGSNVYRELEFMAEYLLGQAEHNLENIRVTNRLKMIAEDKEAEIMLLRDMVADLQRRRTMYIPTKDDVIDGAVADYVNTRGTEIPFTREDHGIYLFGSKRVFIKLEHGKIIIRVGGGYMKIEEFLEIYTPQEMERFESKLKEESNLQRNNILGKYAGNIVNEKTRGKLEISPEKAVRYIKEAISTPKFTQCFGVPRISPKKPVIPSKSPKRDRLKHFHCNDN